MSNPSDITTALLAIPPFPQIAADVLHALKDPYANSQAIVSLVEKDVALTTAVLKLANSGLYGRRRSVASVRSAFRALGSEAFGKAAFRTSIKNYLGTSMPLADLNKCWAHCIACSEISRILATGLNLSPDIALSAGLLHDLGRFGLAIAAPQKHNQLLCGDRYLDVIDAERALFGIDHTEAGRLLAEQFNLPDDIQVCAGRHHDNLSGDEPDILSVVTIACAIASAIGFHVVSPSLSKSLDDVIASAPASMRGRISPDVDAWTAILLNALAAC
ncbi:MAG: HDOD domain-containing protein [Bryobacterales bacterium]|nr:HDOD domain-containing protein [Bryobacterales bacterium]